MESLPVVAQGPLLNPILTAPAEEALISRLLESLDALNQSTGGGPSTSTIDSGNTSPSPLTISTGGSTDPIPSSPTEYSFR